MNNRSDNELLDLCASNDLSFDALQETINTLGPRVSSQNPSCFHRACWNENVTLEIVQLLHSTLPGALQSRNDVGCLPIHPLCHHVHLDETSLIDILRFMLKIDPTLPREVDGEGYLPIDLAVQALSTAFCKELIDAYPESLRVGDGVLPIHEACRWAVDTDTIQYMLELDPEIINAEEINDGYLPIHYAAETGMTKLIELLLKFDPDAASKKANDEIGRRLFANGGSRRLPLHLACGALYPNLSSIQALYDAYPEAILARDRDGDTPFDHAERNQPVQALNDAYPEVYLLWDRFGRTPLDLAGIHPAIDFLQTQLEYAEQSRNTAFMTTVDENGWLPLHHALEDNASLGSIKLLMRSNPAAVQVADQKGVYPLHIACKFSSVKVVKYLVDLDGDSLNNVDANKDSPLHYACHRGNCDVVKYLLEANVPSVSERNNDNRLAIHLLLECGEEILDMDSLEYVETIQQLLLANPEVVRDFMSY